MSDQSLNSQSDNQHNQRLRSIWKNIKQTKNINKPLSKSYKHQYSNHHYDQSNTKHNTLLYDQQKQRNKYRDDRDRDAKDSVGMLMGKLREKDEQNYRLRRQIQMIEGEYQEKIQIMRNDYQKRLRIKQKKQSVCQKQNIYNTNQQNSIKLQKQIQRLTLKIKSLQLQNKSQQQQISKLMQINTKLTQSLSSQQKTLNTKFFTPNLKGQQLLQLTQANTIIQRLIQLLKKTDKYKQFISINDIKDMHYMKNIIKRIKKQDLNIVKNSNSNITKINMKSHCQNNIVNQNLLWSPVQCYKIMLSMKLKYDYLNQDCIQQVLFQMNRIYTSKEQKHISRIRSYYQSQILKLKKRIQQKESYDQLTSKKQISRLKNQISTYKRSNTKSKTEKMQGLKNKGQYQDQLKLKIKQIKLLQERIKLYQTQNNYYDKTLYYEGGLLVIDKILQELQINQDHLKQFQIRFRQRIEDNVEPDDWLISYKEFFQRITELSSQMVERVLGIKENMLKKIGNQKK